VTATVSNHVEMRTTTTRATDRGTTNNAGATEAFDSFVKDARHAPSGERFGRKDQDTSKVAGTLSGDAVVDKTDGDKDGDAASGASERARGEGLVAILADMDRRLRSGVAEVQASDAAAQIKVGMPVAGQATNGAAGENQASIGSRPTQAQSGDDGLAAVLVDLDRRGHSDGARTRPVADNVKGERVVSDPFAAIGGRDGSNAVSRIAAAAGQAIGAHAASSADQPARARVDLVSQRTDFEPATGNAGLPTMVAGKPDGGTAANLRQLFATSDPRGTGTAEIDSDGELTVDGERLDATAGREPRDPRRARDDGRIAPEPKLRGDEAGTRTSAAAEMTMKTADAAPTGLGTTPVGRQVADAVTSSLPGASLATSDPAEAARLQMRAGGAALKTIQIQLQPEQLGKLDVTMRMIDGQLALHIVATEADTVLKIKDDAEGLRKLLGKAGFSVDEAAISIGVRDTAAPRAGSAGLQGQSTPDGQSASGQPGNSTARDGASGFGGNGGSPRGDARPDLPTAIAGNEEGGAQRRRELDPSVYL